MEICIYRQKAASEDGKKIDLLSEIPLLPGHYKIDKNGKQIWIGLNFLRLKSNKIKSAEIITNRDKLIQYYTKLFGYENIYFNWITLIVLSGLIFLELFLTLLIRRRANS